MEHLIHLIDLCAGTLHMSTRYIKTIDVYTRIYIYICMYIYIHLYNYGYTVAIDLVHCGTGPVREPDSSNC